MAMRGVWNEGTDWVMNHPALCLPRTGIKIGLWKSKLIHSLEPQSKCCSVQSCVPFCSVNLLCLLMVVVLKCLAMKKDKQHSFSGAVRHNPTLDKSKLYLQKSNNSIIFWKRWNSQICLNAPVSKVNQSGSQGAWEPCHGPETRLEEGELFHQGLQVPSLIIFFTP